MAQRGLSKRFLEDWAHTQEISIAEAVRRLIQQGLGLQDTPTGKEEAARQLLNVGLADVPGPEELEEEIHRAFGG